MRSSDWAWIALTIGVLGFDLTSPETMSERMDHYRTRWPLTSRVALTVFWMHLMRLLPPWCDPLHGFEMVKLRRRYRCH